jgi:hypothetical protein
VAFASGSAARAETIEAAAEKIRSSGIADVVSWQSLSIGGRLIINTICEAIDNAQLFIADVTLLNSNVLFEIGFAIARKKRVWFILDDSVDKARSSFERFELLTAIGYRPYRNSEDVVRWFFQDAPYDSLDKTVYRDVFDVLARHPPSSLMYLKSEIETDASIRMSRRIDQAHFSVLVDDPSEMRRQSLPWYIRHAQSAIGVIGHLLSSEHRECTIHNAKVSLVGGCAFGFGKPTSLLAHEPFTCPIDYRDLLRTHDTASRCEELTNEWIGQLERTIAESGVDARQYQRELKAQTELQQIALGDPVAELEADTIAEYFVTTATYNETYRSNHSIVVGRKGTGKTAMLYQLQHAYGSDPRDHVCVIKPVAYEVEGVLRVLEQTIPTSEQGYLVESLWKFLVYTELAKSVYEAISARPRFLEPDDDETALLQFVDSNASVVLREFSIRLESAVNRLRPVGVAQSTDTERAKISEVLHADLIPKLRAVLGKVLSRKNRVIILVDNLDKAWDRRSDLSALSQLLFGLLGVSGRIKLEFETARVWREPVNLSLILFLRSDIFVEVMRFAKERDKLPVRFISWDEPDLLLRVVEERFARCGAQINRPKEIWERYFCPSVGGVPTSNFLLSAILPRPRDLIYLVKSALDHAVNSSRVRIEETDVRAAVAQYSRYALDSLIVEGAVQEEHLEELLYEFAGMKEVIDATQIRRAAERVGVPGDRAEDVIGVLVELTFLGVEVQPGRFEFLLKDSEWPKFKSMARRISEAGSQGNARYRINPAFHAYLEVQSST